MLDNTKIVRKRIRFIGEVQGVGFRYRAKYSAENCGVTGFVENEWDGSVLMEAQGTELAIFEMQKMISQGRFISIDRVEVEEIAVEEHEYGFHKTQFG